jgi:hypothetical protein
MKSRTAGSSKDRVSELFNLLERTVEHKLNAIRMYVYNVDETAFKNFILKTRKSDTEKRNIADLVNFKCEERNRYSNCLKCRRCWLLCTSNGDVQNGKSM